MQLTVLILAALTVTLAGCESGSWTDPGPPLDPNNDRLEITFSYADRSGALFPLAPMDLFQITKDGRLGTSFVTNASDKRDPEYSNDGKKLVFTSIGPGLVSASLWVANADLTGLRQLVVDSNPPPNSFNSQARGSWSPDGASLAFWRIVGSTGEVGIAVMNADGTGVRWLAMGGDAPSWSVNGRIAFGKGGSIWTINPDGSGLLSVTSAGNDLLPRWSRDGSRLVFLHLTPSVGTNHTGDFDVVTIRADGTDRRTLVTKAVTQNPSWSPDGTYVLYERVDMSDPLQPRCALYKVPAAGGASVNLTPGRGNGFCGGASWRPM